MITTDRKRPLNKSTSGTVNVPFANLAAQHDGIRGEVEQALLEVAQSGGYTLGPKVREFEEAFAEYVGVRHCIGVNSGTSALHLALVGAGVKPGDEVITVPMTFAATSWAISYIGATPVYVDVDPATYTMDPARIERRIGRKTKVILPVHLYGQPAELDAILEIGRRHGIPVVEDAAQAHGALYNGKAAGSLGLAGCFSFYPAKNLGAYGEAGAIVTNDDALVARLRALRDHAQHKRYHHEEIGFNYRMDAFQGAVLRIKLKHLERWTSWRAFLARRYKELIADCPVQLPAERAGVRHVWHLFVVLHAQRDRIQRALETRRIITGLHYPIPLHLQKAYQHLGYKPGTFPVAERIGRECLSLPLYPEMTLAQQDAVVESLSTILRESQPS
jgi:dTDP-4-amino-4,6-dideoxygalactose transaminase